MKFNERLIELRKKSGLSQEELGEKLNVTRQTISKWELGQTKPEMDKLVEMSKIFNVNIDELVQDKKIENKVNNNELSSKEKEAKEKRRQNIIKAILVILLIIILSALIYLCYQDHLENKKKNPDSSGGIFAPFDKFFDKSEELIEEHKDKFEHDSINSQLEFEKGNNYGEEVKDIIDDISIIEKKHNQKIIIIYNDKEFKTEEERNELKDLLNSKHNYNISFDYEDKKINKMIIKREVTDFEINSFNGTFEHLYSGSVSGLAIRSALDDVLRINRKGEYSIAVEYKGNVLTEEGIKDTKKLLDSIEMYEVEYDYDKDGFINKMIIE